MNVLPPAIEAQGLGRDYGEIRALDALTIAVPSGGLVALLGPNGAGKTTAMLLLATLLTPSRGSARVLGHDVLRERTAIRRRLGLVFQEPTIDGLLTVEENLVFAARLAGLRGARRRAAVSEALDRTRLAQRSRQAASTLSGGLRRLTDVARATLHAPDLLLLDEPTVGLDPEHRRSTWEFIDAARRTRGVTVLFSTHYLAEAERADHVIMLSNGRVVADDTPDALRAAIGPEATLEDVYFARALTEGRGASRASPDTEKALQ